MATTFTTSARETAKLSTRLKIVTGKNILQTNRASFTRYNTEPLCLMCNLLMKL